MKTSDREQPSKLWRTSDKHVKIKSQLQNKIDSILIPLKINASDIHISQHGKKKNPKLQSLGIFIRNATTYLIEWEILIYIGTPRRSAPCFTSTTLEEPTLG